MSLTADLAWSLTGENLALASTSDAANVVAQLAEHGFDAARLELVRDAARARGGQWPMPVQSPTNYGFAQFHALRQQVLRLLQLDDVVRVKAAPTRPLTDAERRLMADLPPHFGRV